MNKQYILIADDERNVIDLYECIFSVKKDFSFFADKENEETLFVETFGR